ncbi:WD40 repeat-like protein [Rhizoclosmatium globosum]|uniref:WD40 repeat-like protein n=1 Tax=Rhizoclosmatium globosum TaxID=329046 RepID=A0A1Y2C0G8_9FUNG|nr:WD40 repeat-like protein [Rhizoclosmatium globosum]|eukprot:ORY40510.1 WD40 repeat-like protein [Rhizoclosmatium globosum]
MVVLGDIVPLRNLLQSAQILCLKPFNHINNLLIFKLSCETTVSNDGKYLAIGSENGVLTILDTSLNAEDLVIESWQCHNNNIIDLLWTPDDHFIITSSGDQTCKLWDVETHKVVSVLGRHRSSVKNVTFSEAQPNTFATASRDGTIALFDVRCTGTMIGDEYTQKPVHEILDAHSLFTNIPKKKRRASTSVSATGTSVQSVVSVKYLIHNPNLLASAGASDGLIKFWDIRSRPHEPVQTSSPPPTTSGRVYGFTSMALDPTGSRLYATSKDNSIHEYPTTSTTFHPQRQFTAPSLAIDNFYIKIAVSPDASTVACGSSTDAYLFDLTKGGEFRDAVVVKGKGVTAVDFVKTGLAGDGFVTCSDDYVVRMWGLGRVSEEVGEKGKVREHLVGRAEVVELGRAPERVWKGYEKPVEVETAVVQGEEEEVGRDTSPETVVQSGGSTPAASTRSRVASVSSPVNLRHDRERTLQASASSAFNSPVVVGTKKSVSGSATPAKKSLLGGGGGKRSLQNSPVQTVLGKYFVAVPKKEAVLQNEDIETSEQSTSATLDDGKRAASNDNLETPKAVEPLMSLDDDGDISRLLSDAEKETSKEPATAPLNAVNAASEVSPTPISPNRITRSATFHFESPKPSSSSVPTSRLGALLSRSASDVSLQKQAPKRAFGNANPTSANQLSRNSPNPSLSRSSSNMSRTSSNRSALGVLDTNTPQSGGVKAKRTYSQSSSGSGSRSLRNSCGGENVSCSSTRTEDANISEPNKRIRVFESQSTTKMDSGQYLLGVLDSAIQEASGSSFDSKNNPPDFGTCECGCKMIDSEGTCECILYCSTILNCKTERRKGDGRIVVCLDLGIEKENVCPYHYGEWGL